MKSPKALVNEHILAWARRIAGFSLEEAAKRLQKTTEQLQSWEAGEDHPTLVQLRAVAALYKRPFSDFYLEDPPEEEPFPHDFRRLPGEVALNYSPALRHQMRLAQARRDIFLELASDIAVQVPSFGFRAEMDAEPESLGVRLREFLGVRLAEQQSWRTPHQAYRGWRAAIEARHALTFQIAGVDTAEALGFSLAFDVLPVIAVNQKLKPNGRTFTLLHEFVHVAIGASGLCDLVEETVRPAAEQRVEVFCNAVAAAALVPRQDLLAADVVSARGDGLHAWSNEEIEAVARRFSVSEEVVLRRLLAVGRTTLAHYKYMRAEYVARYARLAQEERQEAADQEMKRNMPRETLTNLGPRYTRLVLESFNQDNITLVDASRYLGLKAKHIRRLEDMVLGT